MNFHRILAPILGLTLAGAPGWAEPPMIRWSENVEAASGGGHRGPWRMNDSEFHYVDDPSPAINAEGFTALAWVDNEAQDIFFQLYEPDDSPRHAEPVNVSRSAGTFSWLPRLVLGSGEAPSVYVLWQEILFSGGSHGGEILFARSTDGGRSFSAPLNLSNTTAGAGKGRTSPERWHNGSLDIARCPEGHLYAAWTEYEGALWFSKSMDNGRSFTEPARIDGDDDQPARGPALAVGDGERVHLAWTLGEAAAGNLRYARSDDHGRSFGTPRTVHGNSGNADAPKLIEDAFGTLHLVYGESPDGPMQAYSVRHTVLRPGEENFDEPRALSADSHDTPEGTVEFESAAFPHVAMAGEQALVVAWELFPRAGGRSIGMGYTVLQDGTETFAPPEIVPGTLDPARGVNGSQQGLLMRKLAANNAGQIVLVNSTFRLGEHSHVWLFRGTVADGVAL